MKEAVIQFFRRPKVRVGSIAAAALFLFYLLAGYFVLPPVLKWQLVKRLPLATHRVAAVREVRLNPLALSLTVRGLSLSETNGQPFASFEEFYANFQLSTLFRFAWTFDKILLREPRVEVILDEHKQFNFANLLAPAGDKPPVQTAPNGKLPRLLVFDLTVTNGLVGFADRSRKTPFRTAFTPINFHLGRFTTQPGGKSPYAFTASGDSGRSISWAGTLSAQPAGSSGTLRLSGIQLPKHSPYLEDVSRAQLMDGALDLSADYSFSITTNGLDLAASNAQLTVFKLQLNDPETSEPVAAFPLINLSNGSFDLRKRQVHAASLLVKEPALLVRRRQDGSINLPSLFIPQASPADPSKPANAAPAEPGWILALDDYQLTGGSVQFQDVAAPFSSLLKPVSVQIQHFSTATNAEATIRADMTADASENIALTGRYSANPVRGAATVRLASLDLKRYQPYLSPFFKGMIAAGKADIALEFSHHLENDALQATWTNATVQLSGLEIRAPDAKETPVRIDSFSIENVSGNLAKKRSWSRPSNRAVAPSGPNGMRTARSTCSAWLPLGPTPLPRHLRGLGRPLSPPRTPKAGPSLWASWLCASGLCTSRTELPQPPARSTWTNWLSLCATCNFRATLHSPWSFQPG